MEKNVTIFEMDAIATGAKYKIASLNKATREIRNICTAIGEKSLELCRKLAELYNNDTFTSDLKKAGFKDFVSWAKDAFGLEKSSVYNKIAIGENSDYITVGKKKLVRFYAMPLVMGEMYDPEKDFNATVLALLTKYIDINADGTKNEVHIPKNAGSIIIQWIGCGKISPSMPVSKIRAFLKNYDEERKNADKENAENADGDGENSENSNDDSVVLYTEDGTKYVIPAKVLAKYAPIETTAQ